ncbi:MAG: GGDEF domain-containing protein [Acidobacteriota bacterium]|nr:GGDEF domain-containing protein [Acidobacteriota bacterium]
MSDDFGAFAPAFHAVQWQSGGNSKFFRGSVSFKHNMRNRFAVQAPGQPDPIIIHGLVLIQQVCLALVAQVAAVTLAVVLFKPLARVLPVDSPGVRILFALASLSSTLSIFLSDAKRSRRSVQLSRFFSVLTALIALAVICASAFHVPSDLYVLMNAGGASPGNDSMVLWPATGFALLGVLMIPTPASNAIVTHLADICNWGLCLLTLSLFSQYMFSVLHIYGVPTVHFTSPVTLACLVPLTVVATLRQAEHGAFSIFLGYGFGGKIARFLSPIIILLPFLREAARARLIGAHLIPASYVVAVLTSMSTGLAFVLLLFLAWRLNQMERKIYDFSLRDELTGLYNLRGFYILAEQGLRMANRSQMPFSVMFLDLDNLKEINDRLGHGTGSMALVETAKLLNTTFRETEVIGRVGGDEFVVAGTFDQSACGKILDRLYADTMLYNAKTSERFILSFSVGCATSESSRRQSLSDLVAHADNAMYAEKRSKKVHS